MKSVHQSVTIHQCPDTRSFYPLLEGRKVDFMQRPLVDVRRNMMSVPLLVIGGEMLHTRHYTLLLHSLDIGSCRLSGQIGVLTVIFEIPTAKR